MWPRTEYDALGDRELVELWWTGVGRFVADPDVRVDDEEAFEVDVEVKGRAIDLRRAARIVRLMAQTAPSRGALPMIGTWTVEDMVIDHGHFAPRLVELTRLPIRRQEAILSGLLPDYFVDESGPRRPAHHRRAGQRIRRHLPFVPGTPWRILR